MPGVPTGRGCDACRKQKKKCDQLTPSCSRCTRLQIACVGGGQRRYIFIDTSQTKVTRGGSDKAPLSQVPNNLLATTTNRFLSVLEVTDARFDLRIYGPFLAEIPRRLGRNEALDASVCALMVAMPSPYKRERSPEILSRYIWALKCLRNCLSNPDMAWSPETMCSVYLISICQGWIGKREDFIPNHGEAMAHMLNMAVRQNWEGAFENQLVLTLSAAVALQSIANPKINLDPRLWRPPEPLGPRTAAMEGCHIGSLTIENYMRISHFARDIPGNISEISSTYNGLRADCAKVASILSEVPVVTSTEGNPSTHLLPDSMRRIHAHQQVAYGVLLFLVLALNSVLQEDACSESTPQQESVFYVEEVIALAHGALQYRPLGSSMMPICLVAAWSVTDDVVKQAQLTHLISEYQSDFSMVDWMSVVSLLKRNPQ